jgi:hypothetical protein
MGLYGQLGHGDGAGVTPAMLLEREEKPSEKNEPIGGSHLSFVEEKGEGTLSGFLAGWATGRLWCWAGMAPPAFLFIFLSFFFSFFCFLFLP